MTQPSEKAAHIDLADVGAVAVKALTSDGHDGKVYQLSGPAALNYGEVAAIFSKLLGKPVNYVKITHEDMLKNLLSFGLPQWQAKGRYRTFRSDREWLHGSGDGFSKESHRQTCQNHSNNGSRRNLAAFRG